MFGTLNEQFERTHMYNLGYLQALKDNNIELTADIMKKLGLTKSNDNKSSIYALITDSNIQLKEQKDDK